MFDETVLGLILGGVVVLVILVSVGVRVLRNFRNRQDRLVQMGEEVLRAMGEEEEDSVTTAQTSIAPPAGQQVSVPATAPAATGQVRNPKVVALEGRMTVEEAKMAAVQVILQERDAEEEDPLMKSYQDELDSAKGNLKIASMEFAGARTEGRAAELSLRAAVERSKAVGIRGQIERGQAYGPQSQSHHESSKKESSQPVPDTASTTSNGNGEGEEAIVTDTPTEVQSRLDELITEAQRRTGG